MKIFRRRIEINIIYGLIVLVPLSIILMLLWPLVEIIDEIATPLGLHSVISTFVALIIACLTLLIFCYFVGAILRTELGTWLNDRIERRILKKVPGYQIIKRTLLGFAERKKSYPAAMVELFEPGTAVLGFVMEENENDLFTVFVPSVPMLTTGSLHIVRRDRVTFLDAKKMEVAECISQWGNGTPKILRGMKL